MKNDAPYYVIIRSAINWSPPIHKVYYIDDNGIPYDFLEKKSLHAVKKAIMNDCNIYAKIGYTTPSDKVYIYKEINKAIKIRKLQNLTE